MSNEKLAPLSGAAADVLYSLFFRGALQSGDIPSKAGANELREAGLVITQHTATLFGGDDHFTFLTAEGQKFAIQYLAETRFGVAQNSDDKSSKALTLKIALDTRGAQAALDELDKQIRNSDAFRLLAGEAFSNEALIQPGSVQAAHIKAVQNLQCASDERRMETVVGVPDKAFVTLGANNTFKRDAATKTRLTDDMREAVLDAVRESDFFQSLQAEMNGQTDSVDNLQQAMQQAATDAIRNALKPGGLLYGNR
ncbi:Fur-regulated protein [Atlantibacter hermannii]|uniref:Fur-regulated protein n=1 Tax=Atlantibacter hermannii TaxID=565 RepID=UPI00289C2D37|nr:Fur-regulated protein [Atlantibacter hermannii]